jgi:hypothetical protein
MAAVRSTLDRRGRGRLWSRGHALRLLLAAWLLAGITGALVADTGSEAADSRRAVILTRALSYDSSLTSRAGGRVVVAILRKRAHPQSEACAAAAGKAFKGLENLTIAGLPFHSLIIPMAGATELEQVIEREGVDALFVCDGLEGELSLIKEVSRRKQVITIGTSEDQVRAGLSLAVVAEGTKLTIVLNLSQSKSEGAAFGSDLFRVARVIR